MTEFIALLLQLLILSDLQSEQELSHSNVKLLVVLIVDKEKWDCAMAKFKKTNVVAAADDIRRITGIFVKPPTCIFEETLTTSGMSAILCSNTY